MALFDLAKNHSSQAKAGNRKSEQCCANTVITAAGLWEYAVQEIHTGFNLKLHLFPVSCDFEAVIVFIL